MPETATNDTPTTTPAAPPPAAPAAATTAAAPAPAPAKGNGKGKEGKGNRDVINIPRPEFMSRVRREAAKEAPSLAEKLVQEKLGVSLAEAQRLIAAGGQPAAAGAGAQASAASRKHEQDLAALQTKLKGLEAKNQKLEHKNKKTYERMKDKLVDEQLRRHAVAAGVKDDDAADFALQRYAKVVRAAIAKGETPPDAAAAFSAMRASHAYLFSGTSTPPAPRTVAATTAPPESPAPGGVTPTPSPAGAPPPQKSVDDMTPQEFAQHTRRYGFTAGM